MRCVTKPNLSNKKLKFVLVDDEVNESIYRVCAEWMAAPDRLDEQLTKRWLDLIARFERGDDPFRGDVETTLYQVAAAYDLSLPDLDFSSKLRRNERLPMVEQERKAARDAARSKIFNDTVKIIAFHHALEEHRPSYLSRPKAAPRPHTLEEQLKAAVGQIAEMRQDNAHMRQEFVGMADAFKLLADQVMEFRGIALAAVKAAQNATAADATADAVRVHLAKQLLQ
jgi:hypothetical protein